LIGDLKKQPLFQKAMAEVRKQKRPIIKRYDPTNPTSVEEWKYQCARQEGFDFLFSLLTGVNDD
jgi:hypothetical protein